MALRRNVTAIARAFANVPEWAQVVKVAEEAGEVVEAYIGAVDANPRKAGAGYGIDLVGYDLVADELCDVALAALVSLERLGYYPIDYLEAHAVKRLDRLRQAGLA